MTVLRAFFLLKCVDVEDVSLVLSDAALTPIGIAWNTSNDLFLVCLREGHGDKLVATSFDGFDSHLFTLARLSSSDGACSAPWTLLDPDLARTALSLSLYAALLERTRAAWFTYS